MKQIIPAPLNIGDTIGVMSPSSFITDHDLMTAKDIVESYGYKTYIHPQTLDTLNQSAGTNETKANAFHDLIKKPDIKAIIFSSGGNRALHWVDMIDFDLVQNTPKIMMGFSDCTVPLNIITQKTGLRTFHGPTFRWFMSNKDNTEDIKQCFETLRNPAQNHPYWDQCPAPLIGGNLSTLESIRDDLNFSNKTLFIEDIAEELSHIDRKLCTLKRHGVFNQISGLIIGQFDNMIDTGRPYGFTLRDMLAEHIPSTLPIIWDAPIGHANRLITTPIG